MIYKEIEDIAACMNVILKSEYFDDYGLSEAKIIKGASYIIDGRTDAGIESYRDIRDICFDIVKGKEVPKYFKFTFVYPIDKYGELFDEEMSSNISSLNMDFTFSEGTLLVRSGVALRGFSMDRSVEERWDEHVEKILKELVIV